MAESGSALQRIDLSETARPFEELSSRGRLTRLLKNSEDVSFVSRHDFSRADECHFLRASAPECRVQRLKPCSFRRLRASLVVSSI